MAAGNVSVCRLPSTNGWKYGKFVKKNWMNVFTVCLRKLRFESKSSKENGKVCNVEIKEEKMKLVHVFKYLGSVVNDKSTEKV